MDYVEYSAFRDKVYLARFNCLRRVDVANFIRLPLFLPLFHPLPFSFFLCLFVSFPLILFTCAKFFIREDET